MLWVCFSSLRTGEVFRIKKNRMELSTDKILEEDLVQSAFQQTLGDEFTFQQDKNLKYKAKYTLNKNINATCYNFKDSTELQVIRK